MLILDKSDISRCLFEFYKENYGQSNEDKWHEPPAINIWGFERDGKFITLICDLQTGEVKATTKDI